MLIRVTFVNVVLSLMGFIFSIIWAIFFAGMLSDVIANGLNRDPYGYAKLFMVISQFSFSISYLMYLYYLSTKKASELKLLFAILGTTLLGVSWIFLLFFFSNSPPAYGIISFLTHMTLVLLVTVAPVWPVKGARHSN